MRKNSGLPFVERRRIRRWRLEEYGVVIATGLLLGALVAMVVFAAFGEAHLP